MADTNPSIRIRIQRMIFKGKSMKTKVINVNIHKKNP